MYESSAFIRNLLNYHLFSHPSRSVTWKVLIGVWTCMSPKELKQPHVFPAPGTGNISLFPGQGEILVLPLDAGDLGAAGYFHSLDDTRQELGSGSRAPSRFSKQEMPGIQWGPAPWLMSDMFQYTAEPDPNPPLPWHPKTWKQYNHAKNMLSK